MACDDARSRPNDTLVERNADPSLQYPIQVHYSDAELSIGDLMVPQAAMKSGTDFHLGQQRDRIQVVAGCVDKGAQNGGCGLMDEDFDQ